MSKRPFSAAAILLIACCAPLAQASTSYLSNFGLTGFNHNGFITIGDGFSYAIEFTTGSQAETLSDAQLVMTTQTTSGLVLTLDSVAAGLPGSVLNTFTTPPPVSQTAQPITFATNYALAANTSYYLVLSGSSTISTLYATATSGSPNGLTPTSTFGATYVTQMDGSGGTYSAATSIPNVQLDVASSAPEPSGMALTGTGLLAAIALGRILRLSIPLS